jgi:hypothetical protein
MAGDLTEERRARYVELCSLSTRLIAQRLIEEGYFGPVPRAKDAKLTHLHSAMRQVLRDEKYWEDRWDGEDKDITPKDHRRNAQRYIARMRSRQAAIDEKLNEENMKATPFAQLQETAVRIEQAIAKAQGVDQVATDEMPDPDAMAKRATVLVLDLSKCSPEVKEQYAGSGG